MTPEQLKASILQYAIQGKLVEQRPEEGTGEELYQQIQAEKQRLIEEKKIKKEKPLAEISEDEILFDIPENWKWCRLSSLTYNWGQKTPDKTFCYIDVGSINNISHTLNIENTVVEAKDASSRAKKIVQKGDVIFATIRPYLKNICIIDRDFPYEPIVSTAFAVMHCPKGLLNKYLYYYLLSPTFMRFANVTNALSHGLTESFLNAALSLRDEVKKDTWSVCFSENGFNEVLWLKYADQHRGFVQIYDLENNDNFLCGKQEKCANCGIKNYGTPLYPIYYSDTPYDATKFAKFVMLRKIAETTATQIPPELYAGMGSALWEQERTTLIKKECHKYDEEWRMITGCIMKPPVMMEWIPSGIILGLRMGVAEENLVVSMAKEAGIKNIYKSYINAQNKLDAYPLKL